MILARADDATGSHRDSERKDIRPIITSTVRDYGFYWFIRGKLCVDAERRALSTLCNHLTRCKQ